MGLELFMALYYQCMVTPKSSLDFRHYIAFDLYLILPARNYIDLEKKCKQFRCQNPSITVITFSVFIHFDLLKSTRPVH